MEAGDVLLPPPPTAQRDTAGLCGKAYGLHAGGGECSVIMVHV